MRVVGIDLAWGERNADGVCVLEAGARARVVACELSRGDEALLARIDEVEAGLLAIDAPIVCPNPTGSRPVDRLTHVHFGRYKCGCYPANLGKCPRPARVGRALVERGYRLGWECDGASRPALEVYPHPAMVRWFRLAERIPYKKGRVVEKRRAFAELQRRLGDCLAERFPELELEGEVEALLGEAWSKAVEDRVDALVCALIGYWHWRHRGERSQVLGDGETGFLVVPEG